MIRPAAPTTGSGMAAGSRVSGVIRPHTISSTPAPAVTNRLRTRVSCTMPMFSALVTISDVPKTPAPSEVTASAREMRGTSRAASGVRPTASLFSTVCPVASASDARANRLQV
ncbi:hypothetical protein ACVWXU_002207 [Streptomyces sp. TE33382]